MVQTFQITGVASAAATAISLGGFIGRSRIAVLTALRVTMRRSYALAAHSHAYSGHALAAHSHAYSGHALAAHSHTSFLVRASNVAWLAAGGRGLQYSNGSLVTSTAHGALIPTVAAIGGTPAGGINGIVAGTPAGGINGVGGGVVLGTTNTGYTIDSNGRYVAEVTHPAAVHANLKPHGAAGPRIEIGNAVRAGDLVQITALMLSEAGGVF